MVKCSFLRERDYCEQSKKGSGLFSRIIVICPFLLVDFFTSSIVCAECV